MGHLIDSRTDVRSDLRSDARTDPPALREDRPALGLEACAEPGARLPLRPAHAAKPDARLWNELLGSPALSSLELAALSALARPRVVSQGAQVFAQHEAAQSLVLVCEGDAALGWRDAEGEFRIERPVRGPGWLDQSAAWIGATHAIDARAISSLVVVDLPRDEVQALLVTHPQLAQRLIASLAREVHALAVSTHGLMHKDAPARFAQWLVQHCQVDGVTVPSPTAGQLRQGVVRIGERKRDIASQLAVTPETLSRLMRSLTRQGLINVAGYTVNVVDLDGLQRIAEGQ
jgi:CRP-like cAMP-binding protein